MAQEDAETAVMNKIIALSSITLLILGMAACDSSDSPAVDAFDAMVETSLDPAVGEQKYQLFCAGCHDPGDGHPGTMKLALLKGEDQSVLLERTDLNAEYIRFVVRDGMQEMAPFRPTDINDSELDSLIAFILSNNNSAQTPVSR
jgi:mono/diheme cytochrome c family protein